jgi:hypothetical protein
MITDRTEVKINTGVSKVRHPQMNYSRTENGKIAQVTENLAIGIDVQ